MIRKTCYLILLLGLALTETACSTDASVKAKSYGLSYVSFYDATCAQDAMEILNAFHVPHEAYFLPHVVWTQWRCIRDTNNLGQITLVLVREPTTYRLTLVFGENRHVIKADVDPKNLQEVIESMARNAWFDSLTDEGRDLLAKNGSVTFMVTVKSD